MVFSRSQNRKTQFVILAPSVSPGRDIFLNRRDDNGSRERLLAGLQRLRGQVYVEDGAIRPDQLTSDGRHISPIDEESWHVLSVTENGEVCACLRYLEESKATRFDDLWVRHAAAVHSAKGAIFRYAVEQEMLRARELDLRFGEVGGWAVARDHRWTLEPLRIILATYGFLELLGGCAGVATATFRHSSSSILRRIGLRSLVSPEGAIPPYYDPRYGCKMEILGFDSRYPNRKYREAVSDFATFLKSALVLYRRPPVSLCTMPSVSSVVGIQIHSAA